MDKSSKLLTFEIFCTDYAWCMIKNLIEFIDPRDAVNTVFNVV